MYISFVSIVLSNFTEKIMRRIKATKCWMNNAEINALNQDLKKKEVEGVQRLKIAKGVSITKSLINMYLKEYEITKLNRLMDNTVFKRPSIEKIFNVLDSNATIESKWVINWEKQIFFLKSSSPRNRMDEETAELR